MNFPVRNTLFVIVVGLLVIPLQTTFIPHPAGLRAARHQRASSWPSGWRTPAYGLPFAIFLLRNYMGCLPREVFESAYIDGASRGDGVLPAGAADERPGDRGPRDLPVPVRLERPAGRVHLPRCSNPADNLPMTVQIANLVTSLGGGLAAPRAGRVHLDGAAAGRVHLAPAVLRPRHHGRSRQGLITFAIPSSSRRPGWPAGAPSLLTPRITRDGGRASGMDG